MFVWDPSRVDAVRSGEGAEDWLCRSVHFQVFLKFSVMKRTNNQGPTFRPEARRRAFSPRESPEVSLNHAQTPSSVTRVLCGSFSQKLAWKVTH